ncbi:hypothetical protein AB833_13085 [Chromatiales bacterium (ex Bugula neritina AB1)]|nr:hypothetical protein AB833_13085 [Chromatiales bacterium (ex Bugula neritina AB1)]
MSYKAITTYIDDTPECEAWCEYAIDLALQHNARLVAVAARNLASHLIATDYLALNSRWVSELQERIDKNVSKIAALFERQCEKKGLTRAEVRVITGTPVDAMKHEALFSDLIVLGQYQKYQEQNTNGASLSRAGLQESLLMSSARPILYVPTQGKYAAIADHVLIAWQSSRESALAVRQALPLIQQATSVQAVVVVGKGSQKSETTGDHKALITYLALHGVSLETKILVSDSNPANMLLSHACDNGAELLVMGGYGHTRLKEWAIGGVTKTILESMTLPVLMAH